MKTILLKFGWIPVVLLTIAFSLKILIEPDVWWQLAAGEHMMNTGSILKTDPFSFTFAGTPWINIKWGYELLIAWLAGMTSPESLPILQAIISLILIWVIARTAELFMDRENEVDGRVAIITGILFFLIASEYRMNTRPEMFSHLFTGVFILMLSRYEMNPTRKLFWLIPIQLIWVNVHDGYVVGLVLTAIFLVIFWLRYWVGIIEKKPLQLTGFFILLIVATMCNPYGYSLLIRAPAVFSQVKETKFTTEFLDYTSYQFWTRQSYMVICLFLLVFLVYLFRMFRSIMFTFKKKVIVDLLRFQYLIPVVLMGAFTVLALMAYRNIVFLAIVCTPHAIHVFEFIFNKLLHRVITYVMLFLWLLYGLVYGLVVTQHYQDWSHSKNQFGLGILSQQHPIATANFLNEHKDTAPVFSDYLSSSFLLWKLQPEFKSYIDLRDFEIFTPEFFDRYAEIIHSGEKFLKADSQYHFGKVVLLLSQNMELHRYLYHDSVYHLTHLDAVCAVYEKRKVSDSVFYSLSPAWPQVRLNTYINHVMNPVYLLKTEDDEEEWAKAVSYYHMVGDEQQSVKYLSRISLNGEHSDLGYSLWGNHYLSLAQQDTSSKAVLLLDSAEHCFREVIQKDPENAASNEGMASVHYAKGQYKSAIKYWEVALVTDHDNLNVHLYVADCYEKLAALGNARENYLYEIHHLLEANRLNPENPFIETDLGFIYAKLKKCDLAIPYLEKVKDFKGLSEEDKILAKQYLQDCR